MTDAKNLGWSASEYVKLAGFDSEWRDSWWNQDYLELLSARLRLSEVSSMLDVGCGVGHWGQRLSTLLPAGAEIVGVDHEPGFLEAARKRAEGRPHRFEYREASGERLPFESDRFDLVTCQTVLIHVPDARVVLAEMLRVLRPGGVLLVAEPNNLLNAMVNHAALPRAPFDESVRLLAFQEACMRGKAALGQGDGTIGEALPLLFAELGLEDRRVYTNDRAAVMVPPYADPRDQTQIDQLRRVVEQESSHSGDRSTARRLFLAGGGLESSFDELWALEQARMQRALADIDAERFASGGGFSLYVVSGRKPMRG